MDYSKSIIINIFLWNRLIPRIRLHRVERKNVAYQLMYSFFHNSCSPSFLSCCPPLFSSHCLGVLLLILSPFSADRSVFLPLSCVDHSLIVLGRVPTPYACVARGTFHILHAFFDVHVAHACMSRLLLYRWWCWMERACEKCLFNPLEMHNLQSRGWRF